MLEKRNFFRVNMSKYKLQEITPTKVKYSVYRKVVTGDTQKDKNIQLNTCMDVSWAYGSSFTFGYHSKKGVSKLGFKTSG